jgi:proteasome assembly chaperone (PAC2) family protein
MEDILRFIEKPRFDNPALIIGWQEDAGRLSSKVIDYINEKIGGRTFCEIEPVGFFSLEGVAIDNDVAQFPQARFYGFSSSGRSLPEHGRSDLVTFKANEPQFDRYKFLSVVSDLAQLHCKISELYTIGGTICSIAHTKPRNILAVFNQRKIQDRLRGYGLKNMSWEGPPAISSYLLWTAQRRNIPGVSLWIEVPFYLAADADYKGVKKVLSFLDKKFNLNLPLGELDAKIRNQDAKIEQLKQDDPEVNRYIGMLESKLSLSGEEQVELTKRITETLAST